MANPSSLKPFKKGDKRASEAGKKSKRKGIDEKLRELASKKKKGITLDQAINLKLIELAENGDMQAIREYMDRCYGKPKQTIDTNNTNTTTLSFEEVASKK